MTEKMASTPEIDHVFLFVENQHTAFGMMEDAGLRVNYSRKHEGQGTTNICACLDDMFLELLWLDGTKLSPETERISLGTRGRGTGSPIGVAWRGSLDLEQVPYHAPFLLRGMTIPVAKASLDPNMPFVFGSPDARRPIDRNDELVGDRQSPNIATMDHCEIISPEPDAIGELLSVFPNISVAPGPHGIRLKLLDSNGDHAGTVSWSV